MRYMFLIVAYMLLAFIVGLGYLFPNRPISIFDFFLVAAVILPIIALFDYIGQKVIESEMFNSSVPALRIVVGIGVLALFIVAVKLAVGFVGVEVESW